MTALEIAWFFLVGIFLTVYAVLDGFDLGVGIWHPFVRGDRDRRILLNAIGPVWDGNEVWLVTGGAALFAAFPAVYAAALSAFYMPVMLIVFALILRAVSVEFRSKERYAAWRGTWDAAFAAGSIVPALLFPVAVGNLLRGIPLDARGDYTGGFFDLLSPYALVIGAVGFTMFAAHGAIYIALKTEGDLMNRAVGWALRAWMLHVLLFITASGLTIFEHPERTVNFKAHPVLWTVVAAAVAAMGAAGYFLKRREAGKAFVASSLAIAGLMGIFASSIFPAMVPASDDPSMSLTLAGASSSQRTLGTMLVIAAIGMPVVIGYTIWIYRTFRGKVKTEHLEY